MEKYLFQLITDIWAAHRPEETIFQPERQSLEEHFAELETWIAGINEDMHAFGWHCGLESVQFPPAAQLTEAQMKDLVNALYRMFVSWNIATDLPLGLPVATAYRLLVSILDRRVTIVAHGFVGIEFCQYDPGNCPFGKECCWCKDI